MNKKEVEREINGFIKSNMPQALEKFEVILKPVGHSNINSVNIQNLVNAVYRIFMAQQLYNCTNLYILVRQFARAFGDTDAVTMLQKIWEGKEKNSIPVPTAELLILRDLSNPTFKLSKTYNLGIGPVFTLGDLNLRLQLAKTRIMDVFNKLYVKHDIQEAFTMPTLDISGSAGMPSL